MKKNLRLDGGCVFHSASIIKTLAFYIEAVIMSCIEIRFGDTAVV